MKKCFKCGAEKPLRDFYRHARMADGHLNKCKQCAKKDVMDHRLKNIDRIRAYDRNRGSRQPPEYLRNYRKKNPEKWRAHQAIQYALRSGKMKRQPCEKCGSRKRVEGHHDDYNFPLSVRWLCSVHHKEAHKK